MNQEDQERAKYKQLADRAVRAIWWSASINKYRDQTGIAHAVHGGGTLCGARPFDMGGSFVLASETGCQECKRCRKIINKAAEAVCTSKRSGSA